MYLLESHIVPEEVIPSRLSDYLPGKFQTISTRKGIKKALKRGQILVDGQVGTSGHWVQPQQKIQLFERTDAPPKALALSIEIFFEDEHLAIVRKPAGLIVSGNQYRTLYNALPGNITPSTCQDALPWPLPAHRLDGPTAGLVLVAKTHRARTLLGQQFEQREIEKTYDVIAVGQTPSHLSLSTSLDQKEALTEVELVKQIPSLRYGHLSHCKVYPRTGRTHQIRRHLAEAGFPILGDKLYGKEGLILQGKGLFLAATALKLLHPITHLPISVSMPPPLKYDSLWARENRYFQKKHSGNSS